jgi:hypothetical protein
MLLFLLALQDALSDATSTERSEAEKEGIKFFNYKIDSPVSVLCNNACNMLQRIM